MKKLPPKKANRIAIALLGIGALIGAAGALSEITGLVMLGMFIMITSFAFRLLTYRCPHCGAYLDRSTGDFCPFCRREIS